MTKISPSTLQSFNNELVKGLETLRENRFAIASELEAKEATKLDLANELEIIQRKLDDLNKDMARKYTIKNEYERLIAETEDAYLKIVDSSQTLLEIMHKQSSNLSI